MALCGNAKGRPVARPRESSRVDSANRRFLSHRSLDLGSRVVCAGKRANQCRALVIMIMGWRGYTSARAERGTRVEETKRDEDWVVFARGVSPRPEARLARGRNVDAPVALA
ncbi:hypothetical protein KM043_001402 [Ampulex compressa]|nr:hypothetical protein KM043_001402 [Ampulex compressa]